MYFTYNKIDEEQKIKADKAKNKKLIINNLIADYLQNEKLICSQSIFISEANLTGNTISIQELGHMFNITQRTQLTLLDYLIIRQLDESLGGYKQTCSRHIQVGDDLVINKKVTLTKYEQKQLFKECEESKLKFKRDTEKKMRVELDGEVSRVKECEVAAVRLQEASKYRAKMEEYRTELERIHNEKLADLRKKEVEMEEVLRKKENQLEVVSNEHKKKVFKHIERIKVMEQELKGALELRLKEILTESNRLKKLQAEYEQKVREVDELKEKVHEQIRNKMKE